LDASSNHFVQIAAWTNACRQSSLRLPIGAPDVCLENRGNFGRIRFVAGKGKGIRVGVS